MLVMWGKALFSSLQRSMNSCLSCVYKQRLNKKWSSSLIIGSSVTETADSPLLEMGLVDYTGLSLFIVDMH